MRAEGRARGARGGVAGEGVLPGAGGRAGAPAAPEGCESTPRPEDPARGMSHAPANSRRSRCRRPRASSCSVWPPSRVDGAAAPGTCPPETSSIATSSSWAVFEHDLQHGTWIGEREPVSRARPVAFLGATLWHKGCRKAWVSRDGRAVGGRTSVDDDGAMRMSYSRLVGLDVLYRLRRSPGRCGRRRRRTTAAKTAGWRGSNLRL